MRLLGCFLVGLLLSGCGGIGAGGGGSPPPPPSLTLKTVAAYYGGSSPLNLTYAIAGQGSFTLLVNGTGFTNSSVVEWNGNPIPTTFGDGTDVAASVSSSFIGAPGNAAITVKDSGATSNSVAFAIGSPAAATAGVMALITVARDGSPANGDSLVAPSISATGRYVAFQSNATNLASGLASNFQEIYERDTCVGVNSGCTPSTSRVTVTYDGSAVNGHSRDSAISADGRYVAFDSSATNILPNTGICGQSPGFACVFLRDTCIGAPSACTPSTGAISLDTQGQVAIGFAPVMTPDGRFVAFQSAVSNLVVGGTNGIGQVFLRDTCNGASSGCAPGTTLVSVPSSGSQGNQNSELQAPSETGRYVAFMSWATNMVPNETVVPGIFWRDSCLGTSGSCTPGTMRADVASDGAQPNNYVFTAAPAVSSDGRLVAFGSGATNLVSSNVQGQGNVYVRDTCASAPTGCTPSTSLVSLANDGSVANCGSPGNQSSVSVSSNGRFISFGSIATNLTPDDTLPACSGEDIFVRDTCFAVASGCVPSTVRVSVANTSNPGTSGNAISFGNVMSADGHYVVFISAATNFLPVATGNGHAMVYLAKTGF
jgi:hypothetical protein